jgi:acetyl esterase/lipase
MRHSEIIDGWSTNRESSDEKRGYQNLSSDESSSCSILPLGIVMKPLIFALCVVSAFGSLSAQKPVWQPSPGHTQVPIWPGRVPDPKPVAGPEFATTPGKEWLVAGRPAVGVSNVSRPTMTVYSPKGKNTGAAVVVFPGGGYQGLAIDLEGTEVCDWLTPKGITCVLLKYRPRRFFSSAPLSSFMPTLPTAQSVEFWHALKELGVTTQLVIYADEGHSFFKEADRIDVTLRTLEWFDQHMNTR